MARPISLLLLAASALAAGSVRAAPVDDGFPPAQDRALGRALLKEMIETDTTHAKGSTGLALAIAARIKTTSWSAEPAFVEGYHQFVTHLIMVEAFLVAFHTKRRWRSEARALAFYERAVPPGAVVH